MNRGIVGAVALSASIFSSMPAVTEAQWKAIEHGAGQYRILQNLLVALGATEVGLFSSEPIPSSLCAVLTAYGVAKFPSIVVSAVKEQDFSPAGEVSDVVALLGLTGFWSDLITGETSNHDLLYAAGLLLNNAVVAYFFNLVNHAIKKRYPKSTDEFKRRVARFSVIAIGNVLIPLLLYLADSAGCIEFNVNKVGEMITVNFLCNTVSRLAAEIAGHMLAKRVWQLPEAALA